jgi:hypothetical protein
MPALALPDAPAVVRDQLVLPYVLGRDFADALVRAGGWDAVRRAWADPPTTTEQVLHPEKYLRREAARTVTLGWAPAGAPVVDEGVLGEMLTRTLLGDGSNAAAAGWGGDTFRAWDVGGSTLLVWKTAWDDAREAAEFDAALRARLAAGHAARAPEAGAAVFERDGWRAAVRADGATVTLVRSDAPAAFAAALAARP